MKMTSIVLVLLVFTATITLAQNASEVNKHRLDPSKLQDGDILFIRSHSERADAIRDVTRSNLTHCGLVFRVNGVWTVFEGAGRVTEYKNLNEWQDAESSHDIFGKISYERISVSRLAEMKNWLENDKREKVTALRAEAKSRFCLE